MSTTNNGGQLLYFSYGEEATGEGFNKTVYKLLSRGIYSGGDLVRSNDTTVLVSPMICFFEDTTNDLGLKIESTTNATVSITPTTPYVIGRFSWISSSLNYMEFLAVAYADIGTDDIIFGKGLFTGSVLSTTFDYCRKSYSREYYEHVNDYYPPFKVEASEPYDQYVQVRPGEFYTTKGNKVELSTITTSPQFSFPVTSGRVDFLCITESGILTIVSGQDNSGYPLPSIPYSYFPLAKVTLPSASTSVKGTYIEYIYNKDIKNSTNINPTNWTTALNNVLGSNWSNVLSKVLSATISGLLISGLGANWQAALESEANTAVKTNESASCSGNAATASNAALINGLSMVAGAAGSYVSRDIAAAEYYVLPAGLYMMAGAAAETLLFQIKISTTEWLTGTTFSPGLYLSDGINFRIYNSYGGTVALRYRKLV